MYLHVDVPGLCGCLLGWLSQRVIWFPPLVVSHIGSSIASGSSKLFLGNCRDRNRK